MNVTDADTTAAETGEPVAQIVQIDPRTARVEDNIRQDVKLSTQYIASVRLHGVIVPVLAYTDSDGTVVVRDGQRRLLAAREVGLATIPAYVVDKNDETRIRVIEQMIANEHREALTTAERAAAWRQLSLEGMSVVAIAKQTGAQRNEVKAGLTVAGHDIAAAAVAEYDLTLDQAAVLVELDDDPDAVTELREVARKHPDSFDHYAQRALDAKATREEIAALRSDYEARGVTVVDWPEYGDTDTVLLRDLQDADGNQLTEENYAGQPGYAVAIAERWGSVSVGHVVVDWQPHGLRRIGSTGTVTGGKMTEDEKAERRQVVANNKAWVSAEKVRRTWLSELLGRKRLPADALPFAAITLATSRFEVGKALNDGHPLAETLLGQENGSRQLAALVEKTPTKATHVAIAIALGALEAATGKHTWRNPDPAARRYFRQLAAWGYTLSDVEQLIIIDETPAEVESPEDENSDAEPPEVQAPEEHGDEDHDTEPSRGSAPSGSDTREVETDQTTD